MDLKKEEEKHENKKKEEEEWHRTQLTDKTHVPYVLEQLATGWCWTKFGAQFPSAVSAFIGYHAVNSVSHGVHCIHCDIDISKKKKLKSLSIPPPGQQHKRDARPLKNQEITDKRDKSFLFVVGEFVIAFTFVAFLSGGGGVGVETAFKVLLPELAEPRISAVVGAVISYLIALPRFRLIATTASARSCRFRTK